MVRMNLGHISIQERKNTGVEGEKKSMQEEILICQA
jgi:hypothetical protein